MPSPNTALTAEQWSTAKTREERRDLLQAYENKLALQENRPTCNVRIMEVTEGKENTAGEYYINDLNEPTIDIHPQFLDYDQPYAATETYFHEARHGYQDDVCRHPEAHPEIESDTLNRWQVNNKEGYITGKGNEATQEHGMLNWEYYRAQPVEMDANEVARQRTDEYYQNDPKYSAYKQEAEQNMQDELWVCEKSLGEDYQEKAWQASKFLYKEHTGIELPSTYGSSLENALAQSPKEVIEEQDEDESHEYGYSW